MGTLTWPLRLVRRNATDCSGERCGSSSLNVFCRCYMIAFASCGRRSLVHVTDGDAKAFDRWGRTPPSSVRKSFRCREDRYSTPFDDTPRSRKGEILQSRRRSSRRQTPWVCLWPPPPDRRGENGCPIRGSRIDECSARFRGGGRQAPSHVWSCASRSVASCDSVGAP